MKMTVYALAGVLGAVLLCTPAAHADFGDRPDSLQLAVSLEADSAGVFDTLRQAALYCEITGELWPDSNGIPWFEAEHPQMVYRWTLVSVTTADTVFDSVTNLAATNKNRLRLFPLEDDDYLLTASIPDSDFYRAVIYPDSVRFTVATQSVRLEGDHWQMVSLARRPADPAAAALFSGRDFWCSHWHEAPGEEKGNYVNYVSRNLVPGYGYWVRPDGDAPLYMDVAGSSVDSSGTFSLPLLEGWNQVANPFGYAVAWDDAYYKKYSSGGSFSRIRIGTAAGGTENMPRGLFVWDMLSGSYELRDPDDDNTVALMEPWQGYWVYADSALALYIPSTPFFAMADTGITPARTAAAVDGWRVTLSAARGTAADRCCILGMRTGASAGYGPEDAPKPAPMEPEVALDLADGLARDIRPYGGTQAWDIRLQASGSGAVILGWDGIAGVPDAYALYLFDNSTGTAVDMKRTGSYTAAGGKDFSVIASNDPAFDPAALGNRLAVTGTGAVPFAAGTELSFTVPPAAAEGSAVLTIYGPDGAGIAVRSTAAASGRIGWDGRDDAGNAVPSGAYPYVLSVGDARATGLLLKAR